MFLGAGLTEQAQRFAGYAALPASQAGPAVSRATLTVAFLIFRALDIEVEVHIAVVVLLIFGPAVLLIEVLEASLSSTISSTVLLIK